MITKFTLRRAFWFVLITFLAGCGTLPQDKTGGAAATSAPSFTPAAVTLHALPTIDLARLTPFLLQTSTPLPRDFRTHIAETRTARPTLTPSPTSALQPPSCTFPLAHKVIAESKPEEYTFSEPQVVLTAPHGNVYHIAEWLPDNQQILITEDLQNGFVETNDNSSQESISLYNLEKGESKVLAIRQETQGLPSWHLGLNAVVYPIMHYFDIDRANRTYKLTRQIWVSYGEPDRVHMLADNLPQLSFAIKPDGTETVYLSDKELYKWDKSLKPLPSVPIDQDKWDYAKKQRNDIPISYKMAWQPGTSLIFLYSDGALEGGYTFILDADTGKICNLNFKGWALGARWSPDGRYLAIIRSTVYGFTFSTSNLTLLDTVTGNLTTLTIIPPEVEGLHYIDGLAWAPDNRHLLAIGNIFMPDNTQIETQNQWLLYLVDVVSGQSIHVEPEYKNFTSSPDNSLAWSPDGSKLVIHCPTIGVDHICLISVHTAGK